MSFTANNIDCNNNLNVGSTVNIGANNTVDYTLPTTRGARYQVLSLADDNGNTRWSVTGKYSQTQVVTVTNTTVETSLTNNGTATSYGNLMIPPNYVEVGDVLNVLIAGGVETKNQSQELTLRLRSNGTLLHTSNPIDLASVANQWPVRWNLTMQVKSIGVAGQLFCNSLLSYQQYQSNDGQAWSSNSTSTLDSTILHTLDLSAQWSIADPNNIFTCDMIVMNKVF